MLALVLGALAPAGRAQPAGSLDLSFGTGGVATFNTSLGQVSAARARAAVVQPDGKIVVAGDLGSTAGALNSTGLIVTRYWPDGALDVTFGVGGFARVVVGGSGQARAVALQSDGRIVVAGAVRQGSQVDFLVARFTDSGHLDSSFGTDGVVTTDFAGRDDLAQAIALLPDDRIVVGGTARVVVGSQVPIHFAFARYTADGSLDPSFSGDGKAQVRYSASSGDPYTAQLSGLVIQPSGRIVAAVTVDSESLSFQSMALVGLTPGGTLDNTFGTGGFALRAESGRESATALAMKPDGGLVVTGNVCTQGYCGQYTVYAIRTIAFTADGQRDLSFNAPLVSAGGTDNFFARSVAIQPDGRVVVAGSRSPQEYDHSEVVLVRYQPTGGLDVSFGTNGVVTTAAEGPATHAQASALVVLSDGRLVAAGSEASSPDDLDRIALVGYQAGGVLDPGFGEGGRVRTVVRVSGLDEAKALAVQPDGRLVVAGAAQTGASTWGIVVARVESNGQLDASFGVGGVVHLDTPYGPGDHRARAVAVQPDGGIVVAGYVSVQGVRRFALARLTADGQLDPAFGVGGLSVDSQGSSGSAADVALLPDGRILAAGWRSTNLVVSRRLSDGSPDLTFGAAGWVTVSFNVYPNFFDFVVATGVAVQSDGRVVAAGYTSTFSPTSGTTWTLAALVRLTPEGDLDPSFDRDGRLLVVMANSRFEGLCVLSDDAILAYGAHGPPPSYARRTLLARWLPDGSPDAAFGTGGIVAHPTLPGVATVALQPDGALVAAQTVGGIPSDIALWRFRPDGDDDPDFGTNGMVVTDFYGGVDTVSALAVAPDGGLVAAGRAARDDPGDIALARYLGDPIVGAEPPASAQGLALAVVPNPTRGPFTVAFSLPEASLVTVTVFDVLGREVARVADGPFAAGDHTVAANLHSLAPGFYVVRLAAAGDVVSGRVTFVRD